MASDTLYQTERLIARRWREADRAGLAALNADPAVMRYFPEALTRAKSDAFFDRLQQRQRDDGFVFPAIERKADAAFIGFVGLTRTTFPAPFTPTVEIGWRLAQAFWDQGYATEAAHGALAYGFGTLRLNGIVSFTATQNTPSSAVMARIGMTRDPTEDFDHPALDAAHPLARHVLYRLTRQAWTQAS